MKVSRALLISGVCAGLVAILGCASDEVGSSDNFPQDPPIPPLASIIPLALGNQWTFHSYLFDTEGGAYDSVSELKLSVPFALGLQSDSTAVLINWYNYDAYYIDYYYAYAWGGQTRNYLLSFRETDSPVRGVYMAGWYDQVDTVLYPSPILWLEYPADPGATWQVTIDSVTTTMTLVATDTVLYFPNRLAGTASPVTFLPCYLYRQERGDTASYYFYNREYGPSGYQRYAGGELIRSYILTGFVGE